MEIGKLSQRSILYFSVSGVVILVVIFLMIYPDYRATVLLDKNIKDLNTKIETQKMLSPLFQKLLTEIDFNVPEGLPFPKDEKLSQEKAQNIPAIIHGLADGAGLKVVEISSDLDSTLDGSGVLKISVVMRGDFMKFRDLLMALGKLPYLERIERIKIESIEGAKEISLKLWLAKETKP